MNQFLIRWLARDFLLLALLHNATGQAAETQFQATGLTERTETQAVAAKVTFDSAPYDMVFALPWRAGFVTDTNLQCLNGYGETFDPDNCEGPAEICQDGEGRPPTDDIDDTWLPVADLVEKPVDFDVLRNKVSALLHEAEAGPSKANKET